MPHSISRRTVLGLGVSAVFGPALGGRGEAGTGPASADPRLAASQEARRRRGSKRSRRRAARGPEGVPPRLVLGNARRIPRSPGTPLGPDHRADRGDGYTIDKVLFESFPGYHVSALLYRPEGGGPARPGVLSPCGHSDAASAETYQTLHINLAKRGYVVLTYDPVGQGERSQFWDAARPAPGSTSPAASIACSAIRFI